MPAAVAAAEWWFGEPDNHDHRYKQNTAAPENFIGPDNKTLLGNSTLQASHRLLFTDACLRKSIYRLAHIV